MASGFNINWFEFIAPPNPFATWASSWSLSGTNAALDANPSGDGVTNLWKFAANLDPTRPNSLTLVPGTGTSGLPAVGTAAFADMAEATALLAHQCGLPVRAGAAVTDAHVPDSQAALESAVASMQDRIKFVGRDDWAGMEHGRHAIVIVRTCDGRTLQEDTWFEPMSRDELKTKFNELVGPQFGAARTAQLEKSWLEIETAPSINALMQQLRT